MTTRRAFLVRSAAGGAMLLGLRLQAAPQVEEAFAPNAWIRIPAKGKIRLTIAKTEMGQGVRTSLAAILAEELEVPLEAVELVQAAPGPDFKQLVTGGSTSVTSLFKPLREAGATAREMLVAAAAARWNVSDSACRAEAGSVRHGSQSLPYGALAAEASRLPVPKAPALKPASAFRLIGKGLGRVNARAMAQGKATYGQDLALPGALPAVVVRPPVVGGKALKWNETAARAVPGVKAVVAIPSGVAVVALRLDQAREGAEALAVQWDLGPYATFDSSAYEATLRSLLQGEAPAQRQEGDALQTLATAPKVVEAEYRFPFQGHAGIEPPACVAKVTPQGCEVWCGSQHPNDAQKRVAAALGLKPEQVIVHVELVGGGFGRRLSSEFVVEAAELARAFGAPVKVVWNREDDFRHERYHPMSLHRLRGALDASGKPAAWHHRVAAPSIALSWEEGKRAAWMPFSETAAAFDLPYGIPHLRVDYAEAPCPLPLGWWRAIQCMPNLFARECFVDELALAAGKDPLAFRLELLGPPRTFKAAHVDVDTGRQAAVLRLAAEKAGWGKPLPEGCGRGLALILEGGTHVALVAEVQVARDGAWKVKRVTAAADCGLVVNPRSAEGQVEGGVAWGLSALNTALTFQGGRAQQKDYGDFPILPFRDMPPVETHFLASQAHPTGLGEPPCPPVIPAVLNAIAAATGKRLRTLPIGPKV